MQLLGSVEIKELLTRNLEILKTCVSEIEERICYQGNGDKVKAFGDLINVKCSRECISFMQPCMKPCGFSIPVVTFSTFHVPKVQNCYLVVPVYTSFMTYSLHIKIVCWEKRTFELTLGYETG